MRYPAEIPRLLARLGMKENAMYKLLLFSLFPQNTLYSLQPTSANLSPHKSTSLTIPTTTKLFPSSIQSTPDAQIPPPFPFQNPTSLSPSFTDTLPPPTTTLSSNEKNNPYPRTHPPFPNHCIKSTPLNPLNPPNPHPLPPPPPHHFQAKEEEKRDLVA